jgi:hypothetical protein
MRRPRPVIPAQAGTHAFGFKMAPRLRGDDGAWKDSAGRA